MLSIKLLKIGDEDYYLDLASEDYYLSGHEPPGIWVGTGCHTFKLSGVVESQAFKRIFRGYHPDNPDDAAEPLVQSAGQATHQAGWDLTFSAPKSVSVIWSQARPEMRARVQELQFEAVQETIRFMEDNLAFSRTGKAGQGELVPVKLVAATFEHGTSRAVEPQLHTHTIVMNVGVDDRDPRRLVTRTLYSKPLFKNKMLLGALYRAHMAHLLHAEYGFRAYRKRNEFDIHGVSQKLLDAHSTRRKEVLADLEKRGASGAKEAAKSALNTRKKKSQHFSRSELFEQWQQTNARYAFDTEYLDNLVSPRSTNYRRFIPKILKLARKSLERDRNHFTIHEFLREALYCAPEFGVPPDLLMDAVHKHLQKSPHIVPLPLHNRYTTKTILDREIALLTAVEKLRRGKGTQVGDATLHGVLAKHAHLNKQQRRAVRHVTQGAGAIRIVQGYAGVGKTTMLRAAVEAWQQAGYNVIGASFTGAAAQQLESEIGIPCDTINMTLADFPSDPAASAKRYLKHTARQLGRAARGKPTFTLRKPKRPHINSKSVVLLDEAGMINTRHMKMLAEWVEKNNATLALVGDSAQLAAVEGGSPLQSLSNRVGFAEVTKIQRQEDEWARQAAHHMATGQIGRALSLYDQRGLVKVEDEVASALQRLIDDWADHAYDRPERARILTLTNKLVHEANTLAQQKRIERGVLNVKKSRRIKSHDKQSDTTYASNVHIGDRVLFTKTNRTYKVWNGNSGTVIGFTHYKSPLKKAIRVRLDDGTVVKVPLSFRHIRLGYASTVHKAQGATLPEVFVLLGGPTQNKPISYVQGTRSKLATHFYTERALYEQMKQEIEESPLVAQMERDVDLSLASDLHVPTLGSSPDRQELIEEVLGHCTQHVAAGDTPAVIVTPHADEAQQINQACHDVVKALDKVDDQTKRQLAQQSPVRVKPSRPTTSLNNLPPDLPKTYPSAEGQSSQRRNVFTSAYRTLMDLVRGRANRPSAPPPQHGGLDSVKWEPRPRASQSLDADAAIEVHNRDGSVERVSYKKFMQDARIEALYAQAASERRRSEQRAKVKNAYVLSRDPQRKDASPYSAAQYEPSPTQMQSVFSTSSQTPSTGVQAENTFVFVQQQQMAAERQAKMAEVNAGTPWYVQQQEYLDQLGSQKTSVEIEQKLHHDHGHEQGL